MKILLMKLNNVLCCIASCPIVLKYFFLYFFNMVNIIRNVTLGVGRERQVQYGMIPVIN